MPHFCRLTSNTFHELSKNKLLLYSVVLPIRPFRLRKTRNLFCRWYWQPLLRNHHHYLFLSVHLLICWKLKKLSKVLLMEQILWLVELFLQNYSRKLLVRTIHFRYYPDQKPKNVSRFSALTTCFKINILYNEHISVTVHNHVS